MEDLTKKYSNGEVTIVWKPSACIHSTICWKPNTGLPNAFNPREKPWIKTESHTTEEIIAQVKKCPSGALSFYMNNKDEQTIEIKDESIVEVMENGPLLIYGNIAVKDVLGNKTQKNKVTAFCRCGASSNKPYCDGTHQKIGFKG